MTGELEDLVTAADIGRRIGRTRERARQLSQEDGFPPAIGRLGNYTVWRWSDVEPWLAARGDGRRKPADGA